MNMKIILEDGSHVEHKKKFSDGVYAQIGNGSDVKSEQRELMYKLEAQNVAEREVARGNSVRIVKHKNKYLVYHKWGLSNS